MNSAPDEKSLDRLIREMNAVLHAGEYAFCELPRDAQVPAAAIAMFREDEAITVIMERGDAEAHHLDPLYAAAWITLTVHSDLAAVGFLAVVARALADKGVSCNVVSAVYHDHLFVPCAQGGQAIEILHALQLSPLSPSTIR